MTLSSDCPRRFHQLRDPKVNSLFLFAALIDGVSSFSKNMPATHRGGTAPLLGGVDGPMSEPLAWPKPSKRCHLADPPDHYRGHYTFAGTPRGPMPSTTPTPAPTHHLGPLQHPCHPHVASVIATHTRHSNEGPSLPPQPQPIVPNLRAGLAMRPWPTLPANPDSLSLAVGVGNPIQSLSTYKVV